MRGDFHRLISLLFIGAVFLFGSMTSLAGAEVDYGNGSLIVSGSNYISPRMDCYGSDCVVLVYDTTANRLKLIYSRDRFATINTTLTVGSHTQCSAVQNSNYHMAYDIDHYDDGTFIFVYDYSIYTFTPSNLSVTLNYSFGVNVSLTGIDVTGNVLTGYRQGNAVQSTQLLKMEYYLENKTDKSNLLLGTCIWNCTSTPITVDGDVYSFDDGDGHYYVYAEGISGVPVSCTVLNCTFKDIGSFADSYDGIWAYIDDEIYYRNSSGYVKKVYTSDWSSFGDYNTIYTPVGGVYVNITDIISYATYQELVYNKIGSDGIYYLNTFEAPAYSPPAWFTNPKTVATTTPFVFEPLGIAIDCIPDSLNCIAVVYAEAFSGNGFYIYKSNDGFNADIVYTGHYIAYDLTSLMNGVKLGYESFMLPFNIKYNSGDTYYYILTPNNVYKYNLIASPSVAWSVGETGTLASCESIIGLMNNAEHPYAIVDSRTYESLNEFCVKARYLYNGSIAQTLHCEHGGSPLCSDGLTGNAFGVVYSTSAQPSFSNVNIFTKARWNTIGGWRFYSRNDMSSFPSFSSQYYYGIISNDIKYEGNLSGDGVYSVSSGDLSTFGTPVAEYYYDLPSQEAILGYIQKTNGRYNLYSYVKKQAGFFGYDYKAYFYLQETEKYKIYNKYTDPVTGQKNLPAENVSVQLTCLANNATSSSSGSDVTVYSDCVGGLRLRLDTTQFIPSNAIIDFDTFSGCDNDMKIWADYYKSFPVTLTVHDFDGNPVVGASLTFDDVGYTTDSNGSVTIAGVQPILNPSFSQQNLPASCRIKLIPNGTFRQYHVRITKVGYTDYETTLQLAREVGGEVKFYPNPAPLIMEKGTEYYVRVITSDSIEVTGGGSITASGANETYVRVDGVPVLTSTATSFPASFILVDDSASYSLTLNLTYGNYTASKVTTIVNTTSYYTHTFTVPEQYCNEDTDCNPQFCRGNYFYELTRCNLGTGQCEYSITACTQCDPNSGCFDDTTTRDCYFDSECYDLNRCVSSAVLKSYKCGEDGKCLGLNVQCDYRCTDDVCVPSPEAVVCDDSTVVGMLQCTQAGIMNFIRGSYNPYMTLLIVIFIVVIVVTLFVVGFKSIDHVFR